MAELEQGLLNRPELFSHTDGKADDICAWPRGEAYDAPAIRQIVGEARADDFRLSSIVLGLQRASVPDETSAESHEFHHKIDLSPNPAEGGGASFALPLLDAMIPAATAAARRRCTVAAAGLRVHADGCDQSRWTPGSERTLDKLSPILDRSSR